MSHDPVARGARRLRLLVLVAIAAIVALYALARLEAGFGTFKVVFGDRAAGPAWVRAFLDLGMALLVVALVRLTQMLARLGAGDSFSVPVVRRFRGFAFWLMASAACGFVAPLLGNLADDGGDGALKLAIDLRQLLVLGITALLFLIARLLERARAFEQDSRGFV